MRAFHFGERFLVEIDIVLGEEMTLKETHDIAESLQIGDHVIDWCYVLICGLCTVLEDFEDVERAFVHVDYVSMHTIGTLMVCC